ncbi:MAG: hypothetical protein H6910_04785 [Rickettsiaceae bacterium]|nr:hypothetical protein [Rickettsiaceae bacterium]MCP5378415.1 hypothetical protein [Rickettsiaceae bacterium]
MYEYQIEEIFLHSDGYAEVKVSLDIEKDYKIILRFTKGFIEDFILGVASEEEVKTKLEHLLLNKDKFLLIRLVRLALGHPIIKKQLRTDQNGVFSIDLAKWKQILKKLKEEKLETILAEGLEDVVN